MSFNTMAAKVGEAGHPCEKPLAEAGVENASFALEKRERRNI